MTALAGSIRSPCGRCSLTRRSTHSRPATNAWPPWCAAFAATSTVISCALDAAREPPRPERARLRAPSDHEDAAEGEQRPVRCRWVRVAQARRQLVEERGAHVAAADVERVEHGAQRGALDPLEDRIVSGEHVHVRGLPSVDLRARA